jgi:DNA polymerase III delta prime subunit
MDIEANESLQKWVDYEKNKQKKIEEMNQLIYYNQFINEEIIRLHRKIRFLNLDLENEKIINNDLFDQISCLNKELSDLNEKYNNVKEELKNVNEELKNLKNPPKKNINNRKRSRDDSYIDNFKSKRPKKYNYLKNKDRNDKLIELFSSLNTIEDIIALENNENIYDFLKNEKFRCLFNLIPSFKELEVIIGMNKVKNQIMKQVSFFLHGLNSEDDMHHVVITGDPGVGKTTIAKIIGRIYLAMGFLSNNTFTTAKRSDLIAKFLGQTAIKTQKLIDNTEGGVLFIDEVYSLGNKEQRDSFAKECIDTINQNLTEKSNKLLCIVAGYKDDIESCFFAYNQGLRRRFQIRFDIENYSVDELTKILIKFIEKDNWKYKNEKHLNKLVSKYKDKLKYQGGDILKVFKLVKEIYSQRIFKNSLKKGVGNKELKDEDFTEAFEIFDKENPTKYVSESINHLYI